MTEKRKIWKCQKPTVVWSWWLWGFLSFYFFFLYHPRMYVLKESCMMNKNKTKKQKECQGKKQIDDNYFKQSEENKVCYKMCVFIFCIINFVFVLPHLLCLSIILLVLLFKSIGYEDLFRILLFFISIRCFGTFHQNSFV